MVFTNVYNPHSAVSRKNEYLDTFVGKGATLGANCTIVCGVTIGKHAFIGAGSVVTKDIKDYALVVGVPAIQIGWMSEFGEKMELYMNSQDIYICKKTKDKYQVSKGICRKV
jgi:UDP-2-acetamido-3-amino-2,3-dideoxy-glucuronate N-acetyltransferase